MDSALTDSGPVDVLVLRFTGNNFTGEIAAAIRELVSRDLVRIIDLLFVTKDSDGTVGVVELAGLGADLEPAFVGIAGQFEGGLLDAEDAEEVHPGLEPDTSAAVLAVEHRWAIPFVNAVRNAGGEVVDQARIPYDVVAAVRQEMAAAGAGGEG
jgi:hypothetical protein